MNEFHKEMLSEIIKDWTTEQLEIYIEGLEKREIELSDWIKHLRTIRRKKTRKPVYDNGPRGGL